jgi:8-oxo-dGTP pyrophosphatase MutT (NUDIX family)
VTLTDVVARFHIHVDISHCPLQLNKVRDSAILLPLVENNGQAALLFCKRPAYLQHHPSQICFPGGKVEPSDMSKTDTAIRETREELGINPKKINPLGQLKEHHTLTGFSILPIVATLSNDASWHTHSGEVDLAFIINVSELLNDKNWQSIQVLHAGVCRTMDGFLTSHGLLWGATASVVKNFIKLLK